MSINLDDDKLVSLYNNELIALAAKADLPQRLDQPDLTAHASSPICGSEIDVDLKISGDKITAFGFEVEEACALSKTVVAIMADAIIGKTRADVADAGRAMEAMLAGQKIYPAGDWEKLRILESAKDHTARHNAVLLPFEAVEKAFKNKDKA